MSLVSIPVANLSLSLCLGPPSGSRRFLNPWPLRSMAMAAYPLDAQSLAQGSNALPPPPWTRTMAGRFLSFDGSPARVPGVA